jgi:hypothetical protein
MSGKPGYRTFDTRVILSHPSLSHIEIGSLFLISLIHINFRATSSLSVNFPSSSSGLIIVKMTLSEFLPLKAFQGL